jgi:dihydrofolate reductase
MAELSLICAMARNNVIGLNNTMPWHLPEDLAHFKALTTGKVIVMGRNTFASIGRPLPKRTNVVLSRSELVIPGAVCFTNLDDVLTEYAAEQEIMIIGGANLYAQTIARCSKMYLTYIDLDVAGDTFFPAFNLSAWQIIYSSERMVSLAGIGYRFVTLSNPSIDIKN